MFKRILIVGVAAVALALVAPVIGAGVNVAYAGEDCADGASAHASGEDCPAAPQAPAQPAPQPQPTPKPEAPKPEAPKKHSGGGPGSTGESPRSESTPTAPQVVQNTTPVTSGVDTGTIPQGGIQAGAGGTADSSMAGLLWGGALILVVAAGGLTLRRRDGLTS
jgi:hypothetical protein